MGVSRTAGNNWARGYKTYRGGEVVGFVPAVERLAVRQISSRFLPQDERIEIADLRVQGLSVREIGRRLGRAPTVRVATLTGTRPVETDQFGRRPQAARYVPNQKRAGSDEGVRSRFLTSATRHAQFVSPCSKTRAGPAPSEVVRCGGGNVNHSEEGCRHE